MDYVPITRTNYFHTTDPDALADLINGVTEFELWDVQADDGSVTYGFGIEYGDLTSCINYEAMSEKHPEVNEDFYDEWFLKELQKLIAPNDVCIIQTIGHEGLRFLTAYTIFLTQTTERVVDMTEESLKVIDDLMKANELPKDFSTRMDY